MGKTSEPKKSAEALEAFIARHEALANSKGVVVTQLTHPDAEERIYPGVYGGIAVKKGRRSAIYSDGTKN